MKRVALALVCSLLLTALTLAAPLIPTDWARLNGEGVYVPQRVTYAWPSYAAQVGLWVGMVVMILNPSPLPLPRTRRGGEKPEHRDSGWPLIAITILGFGLRVHTLGDLPLIVDEIGFAAHASDILHGQHVPIFAPGHNAFPSVYSWLTALSMALFGQNTFSMRLIPLVAGMLSIPAVYLLGRVWWSPRVGLLAAAFLATYPAHVFYSRMALNNAVDPVFTTLALVYLWRALKRGRRSDYVKAGMMGAVGQYFYQGARLVVVLMGLLAVGNWLLERREKAQRKDAKGQRDKDIVSGSWWMSLSLALMALPPLAAMAVGRLPLSGKGEALRLPADFFPDNTLRAVLGWVGQPDVSPFWLSDAPLLLTPALLVFLAGLAVSLRRWRDARYGVLVASVALATIFGGAIWTAAPLYVRYMTVAPAVALLVGVGLSAISGQLSAISFQLSAKKWRSGFGHVGTVILAVICVQGVVVSVWAHPTEARGRITAGQWWVDEAAQQAAGLSEDAPVTLVAPQVLDELERITLAHSIAAYGRRRGVALRVK